MFVHVDIGKTIIHPILFAYATYSGIYNANFAQLGHCNLNMAKRRLSEAQRWQIIGIQSTGMAFEAIGRQLGYHYTVISRLVRKNHQTNDVNDRARSGRPRVTTQRDDRALVRLVRRQPFCTNSRLKHQRLPHQRLSLKTLRNRLKAAGLVPGEK